MINKLKYESHDEWLSIRNNYIGGSDAGAVVGMNPYKSAYALWAEKRNMIPAFEGNIITKVGSYLEELVAQMFAEETGKKVRKSNFTYVNDKYPFACANVDRLVVGEKAVLEIKTTNSFPKMKKIKGGEFPDEWYCQMTHYLAVTELEKAYLAVLVNCREFFWFELTRDQSEIDALMYAEELFWDNVKSGTAPGVDGSQSTSDAISTIYPDSLDYDIDLNAVENELVVYNNIGKQIKDLKKLQDESANKIKVFMADAGRGKSEKFKVTYSSSVRESFDNKSFMADNKGMDFSKYLKTTTVRTLRINEVK